MTWTTPFTAVVGAVITAAGWNTSARDNLLHLRNIVPDPTSGLPLVGTGTTTAAFQQLATGGIADLAMTTAKIAASAVTLAKIEQLDAPADNEVATYDSATGKIEWQALSALSNSVPTGGVIIWPSSVASIPSGWVRHTNADGRILVSDGTTFSVTWVAQNNYGSSWSHSHATGTTAHGHGATGLTFSGNNNTTSPEQNGTLYDEDEAGNGHNARDGHDHSVTATGTMGGTTANNTAAATSSDAWTIPLRCIVYIEKS
jgi:hypothetical protein